MHAEEHSDETSERKPRRFRLTQRPRVSSTDILLSALKPFDSSDLNSSDDDSYLNTNACLTKLLEKLCLTPLQRQELMKIQTAVFKAEGEWVTQTSTDEKVLDITAASLTQLIICLTSSESNVSFQKKFLLSSPSFTTPRFLLAAIYQRFFTDLALPECNVKSPTDYKIVRTRSVKVLQFWLTSLSYQFDKEMIESLHIFHDFLKRDPQSQALATFFQNALNDFNGIKTSKTSTIKKDIPPMIIPSTPPSQWTLVQIDPEELARQITLFHSYIFRNIGPMEMLTGIWGTTKGGGCPNIIKLQGHFDLLSRYISHSIIFPATPKERAQEFKRWFDVGSKFEAQKNYNGLFSVICGITHRSVVRMEQTMKHAYRLCNKKELDYLVDLCEIAQDFKNYRNKLRNVTDRCVPFIGCFQKDLVYIQESYPNNIGDLINFKKCTEAYKLIETIQMYQNLGYEFYVNDTIQRLIEEIPPCGDTFDLIKLSQEREPTVQHK